MSLPLRVASVGTAPEAVLAFEHVRTALPGYRGQPTEPLASGTEALCVWQGEQPVARVSLQVVEALHGAEGPSGLIGHFEAHDAASAALILREACTRLASRGVHRVLGPMNGSTWARYRLMLPGDAGEPQAVPFLGEPTNPPDYAAWFEAAGFMVAAHYESRIDESPGEPASDAAVLAARVADAGIRVRSLDVTRFEAEARVLYDMSLEAFAENLYYTPLEWGAFHAQYEKLLPLLQPELVLFAESAAGEPIAFQFAYLDPIARSVGGPLRAIVKTVATRPAARGTGLAGHLLDLLRARAVVLGATSVVHALMHVTNHSMKMSSRHRSRIFRRYALYEWRP